MTSPMTGGRPGIALVLGSGMIVLVGVTPVPAFAWTTDWGVAYSSLYSDNIARVATDETHDWVHILSGNGVLRENSDDLTARIFSRLEFRHYGRGTYDDEVMFGLDGAATWALVPRRLSFTVEDQFTQAPVFTTLALTPGNRQNTNAFAAGPDATWWFSPATRFELGGRYRNVYYESQPNDSDRITLHSRLARDLSPITTLSVNYDPAWARFRDDTLNPDYFRQDAYVSGSTRRPTTTFNLDVGHTFIERENSGLEDIDGRLLRAGVTRRLNSRSTVSLYGVEEFSEAGRDEFIVNPLLQITPSPAAINTTDFVGGGLFTVQQVDAAYVQQRTYGTTRANLFWRDLDFESPQLLLDQRIKGGFADVGFDFSAALTAALFGNYTNIAYQEVDREDRDYGVGARGVYRFQRTLSFSLEGRWSRIDSNVSWAEYNERRLVVTVAYDTNYALNRTNPFLELNNPLYR